MHLLRLLTVLEYLMSLGFRAQCAVASGSYQKLTSAHLISRAERRWSRGVREEGSEGGLSPPLGVEEGGFTGSAVNHGMEMVNSR
jgi:hypothetical protein